MSVKEILLLSAVLTTSAAPATAVALGGGPGCSDLPEYDRAVGTLQGLSTCDMSVAEARRIVAAQTTPAAAPPVGPVHHRHHRLPPPQPE